MRILFTACPFYGHVNTLLPLAKASAEAGHDVVLATGADLGANVRGHGLTAWAVGPTVAETGMPMSPDYFVETAMPRTNDLVEQVANWRPDLIVSEETELAGAVVAASTGAAHVVHGLGILAASSLPGFAVGLEGLGRRWGIADLPRRVLRAPYVSVCPPSLQLAADPAERETSLLRPTSGEPEPGRRLPAELATLPHEQTVHLTLGTVFHRRHPGVLESALDAISALPVNVVVTVGPDVDPASFGTRPRHVLIERYLPHAALLPLCDVVVSQGGAGILLGALAHGLPQLVLPQGADQFVNADAAVRAGAALTLDREDATGPAIAEAVTRLLEERQFRDAAAKVRDEIAAMPVADSIIATLVRRVGLPEHHAGSASTGG
jgi:UDP:flavonoid glycosyltransferase YjiC (YdhE family)